MPPKLRASCDACHSAKIKCIKTDTGCQRCDNFAVELACKFSPALPRIYRSHRNRVEDAQTSQLDPSIGPSLLHNSYGPNAITQAVSSQVIFPLAAAPASILDQQDHGIGTNAELDSFFWPLAPLGSTEMPQNLNIWPNTVETGSPTTSTTALTNAATPMDAASSTSLLPSAHQSPATTEEVISHCSSATSSSERTCAGTSCNCFTRLLEAMQSINTHTTTQNPKLDVVLCANRTAAKLCLTSLQCSHSFRTAAHDMTGSCSTIACGLLDRILVSYQAALEMFCANLDDERMTAQSTPVELRLGSFALEQSEHVLWAREIVAREAGKIQVTLKGLEVQGRGIRTVLLAHLLETCETVIDQVSGS